MQKSILIVIVMINQFHDRIELRAFLDGHSVSGVSTNSVMSTSLVKGDGQRRPLLVGVLVLDGDPHQEEAVALTRGFDALLRLHPGDHVVIPRHLLVEASHHRVLGVNSRIRRISSEINISNP